MRCWTVGAAGDRVVKSVGFLGVVGEGDGLFKYYRYCVRLSRGADFGPEDVDKPIHALEQREGKKA